MNMIIGGEPAAAADLVKESNTQNFMKDVVEASPEEMEKKLRDIRAAGGAARYAGRADAFMVTGAYDGSIMRKIGEWNRAARRVLSGR